MKIISENTGLCSEVFSTIFIDLSSEDISRKIPSIEIFFLKNCFYVMLFKKILFKES
jgi:hypothetical protein